MQADLAARRKAWATSGHVGCSHGGGCDHGMEVEEPVALEGGEEELRKQLKEVSKAGTQ